eukprot:snap_masked-scaffold_4-processed-gene-21.35-mRNA-1 protein AED:1.00 eAED:1.00 QI:0/0/0/0/1/1/2/0/86
MPFTRPKEISSTQRDSEGIWSYVSEVKPQIFKPSNITIPYNLNIGFEDFKPRFKDPGPESLQVILKSSIFKLVLIRSKKPRQYTQN